MSDPALKGMLPVSSVAYMLKTKDLDPDKPNLARKESFKALHALKSIVSEANLGDDVTYPCVIPNLVDKHKNSPEVESIL